MDPSDESLFDDRLKDAYEALADEFEIPLSVLALYLDGRLSESGRQATEAYLVRSEQGRKDLELLKQLRRDEAAVRNAIREGSVEIVELPHGLVERMRRVSETTIDRDESDEAGNPDLTHNGLEVPRERLATLLPGYRYRLQPIEPGSYEVIQGSSVVTFECGLGDLYGQPDIVAPKQAAESAEEDGGESVRKEESPDRRLTVRIYRGFRRPDGSAVVPYLDIEVSD